MLYVAGLRHGVAEELGYVGFSFLGEVDKTKKQQQGMRPTKSCIYIYMYIYIYIYSFLLPPGSILSTSSHSVAVLSSGGPNMTEYLFNILSTAGH